MKPEQFKLSVIVGATLIVILIILIVLLFINNPGSIPGTKIAPTPTVTTAPDRSISGGPVKTQHSYEVAVTKLSADQKTRYSAFVSALPYTSDAFDIAYDAELKTVLISIKDPNADAALKQLLTERGVIDIYLSGSAAFVSSRLSIDRLKSVLNNARTFEEDETNGTH